MDLNWDAFPIRIRSLAFSSKNSFCSLQKDVQAGFILSVYRCLAVGHNIYTNKKVRSTLTIKKSLFRTIIPLLLLTWSAIRIINTGKKNEKGNTILSGSLKKIVIPVNKIKLVTKENVVIIVN